MVQENVVIAIIVIVLFVVLALIAYLIYAVQHQVGIFRRKVIVDEEDG